jgi:BMFP domain-containing protein YqiC
MRKELHELIRRVSQLEAQLKDSDSSNCQVRKDVA